MLTDAQWHLVGDNLNLTPREQEVCQLLFNIKTRDGIASALNITPRTVRQHMEQIHKKLHVNSRVGVVLRIIQMRDELGRNSNVETTEESAPESHSETTPETE